jgi:putative membrane protein
MDTNKPLPKKNIRKLINVVSIVIPVVVAALFGVKLKGFDTSFLPAFYATINGVTAVLLVLALIFIKQKKRKAHERTIQVCMVLSLIFLACYVTYHMTSESTKYGGNIGIVYYPLLNIVEHCRCSTCFVFLLTRLGREFRKTQKMDKNCVANLVLCSR